MSQTRAINAQPETRLLMIKAQAQTVRFALRKINKEATPKSLKMLDIWVREWLDAQST